MLWGVWAGRAVDEWSGTRAGVRRTNSCAPGIPKSRSTISATIRNPRTILRNALSARATSGCFPALGGLGMARGERPRPGYSIDRKTRRHHDTDGFTKICKSGKLSKAVHRWESAVPAPELYVQPQSLRSLLTGFQKAGDEQIAVVPECS